MWVVAGSLAPAGEVGIRPSVGYVPGPVCRVQLATVTGWPPVPLALLVASGSRGAVRPATHRRE